METVNGYRVSLEGQDASGKSTLLQKLVDLPELQHLKPVAVNEFSTSKIGDYIRDLLSGDKFLRFGKGPTALSGALLMVNDLQYQEEVEIQPHIEEGRLVVVDRHIDTIYACETPKVQADYPTLNSSQIDDWLTNTMNHIPTPDITFYLSVPIEVQVRRMKLRGEEVVTEDLEVFESREERYRQIIEQNPKRIIQYENTKGLDIAAKELASIILERYNETINS